MRVFVKAFNPAFLAPVETNLSKKQRPPPKPPILGWETEGPTPKPSSHSFIENPKK